MNYFGKIDFDKGEYIMSKKKENKNVTIEDLLTTNGLDEMQLSKMYRITYNCFKAFFWANVIIVFVIMFVGLLEKSVSIMIISSVIALVTSIIYIAFAVMLAKTGSMPSRFAKYAGTKERITTALISLIILTGNSFRIYSETGDILYILYLIPAFILIIAFITSALLTLKNNKVVKQQESEEE